MGLLRLAARQGRVLLVLGLLGGILSPELARLVRPWIAEMVALLLFIAALRIGPRAALGARADLPGTLGTVAALQLALPMAVVAVAAALGVLGHPLTLGLVLMSAAPSISGSPHLAVMLGQDPAPALRLLIVGTALLPLTVLPVFWALPVLGDAAEIAAAALRLLAVIVLSVGVAFALRAGPVKALSADATRALDGLAAIFLAVLVVGLMTAVNPALRGAPLSLAGWLAAVCAANFGLQILAWHLVRHHAPEGAGATAIIAGNRNIALFLIALPEEATTPLLLFIGCYQVPMYTTPLLMRWLYRSSARNLHDKP